jgi:transposase
MLLVPHPVRILLAAERIDMRKSIDGLAAIVRNEWKEDLYAGHLFVFVSKKGDRLKVLTWDNGGFVLTYKRLEQGRFRLPAFPGDALGVRLDGMQLAMLLDGIDVSHVRRPKRWSPPEGARQVRESLIYPDRWLSARRVRSTSASGAQKRSRSGAGPLKQRRKQPPFGTG